MKKLTMLQKTEALIPTNSLVSEWGVLFLATQFHYLEQWYLSSEGQMFPELFFAELSTTNCI